MRYASDFDIPKAVKWWLVAGLAMIWMQVLLGGITRLTGSGLSITKWEIVTGAVPPIGETAWQEAFELYKATPQYQKINAGMSLSDFKFIYFWEWLHRLWARWMGLVFIVPFFFFWRKGWFSRRVFRRSIVVFLLAALVAVFGIIMVFSGLKDRPWVNAYKLTLHLGLALTCFAYLLWTAFLAIFPQKRLAEKADGLRKFSFWMTVVCCLQIALGGVMSGMKAGLFFPTWPLIGTELAPSMLFEAANWKAEHFVDYDTNAWMPALVQFLHRSTAYLLASMAIVFASKSLKIKELRRPTVLMLAALAVQIGLGIWTLVSCIGSVPVGLGAAHQGWAVALLSSFFWLHYQFAAGEKTASEQ